MARLPWPIRTRFSVLYKIIPIAQNKNRGYFGDFFFFFLNIYHENVCCVFSSESHHQGDSNEYAQHTIIL